ncbi:MAG: sulfur transferase domain-containing protein [Planctomycetota bacterium]|nr:sulfur transferase domain-containing protein [Planctomycetota bacterium]
MADEKRWRPGRVIKWSLIALAIGWGATYGHWIVLEHRFETITEGAFYQSAEMPPEALVDVAREHGIKTVIDLRHDGDIEDTSEFEKERAALEKEGIRYVRIPANQVPTNDTVDAFLEIARDTAERPILVHCEHGQGRSVLFAALYRIEFEGWDPERARRATRLFSWRGSFSSDAPKGIYLRNYESRLSSGAGE